MSRLVADYFAPLFALLDERPLADELPALTRSLVGAASGQTAEREDYRQHLVDKRQEFLPLLPG